MPQYVYFKKNKKLWNSLDLWKGYRQIVTDGSFSWRVGFKAPAKCSFSSYQSSFLFNFFNTRPPLCTLKWTAKAISEDLCAHVIGYVQSWWSTVAALRVRQCQTFVFVQLAWPDVECCTEIHCLIANNICTTQYNTARVLPLFTLSFCLSSFCFRVAFVCLPGNVFYIYILYIYITCSKMEFTGQHHFLRILYFLPKRKENLFCIHQLQLWRLHQ